MTAATAGTLAASAPEIFEIDLVEADRPPPRKLRTQPRNAMKNDAPSRRLGQSLETTQSSGDDDSDDDDEQPTSLTNGTKVFTPMGECELCPRGWRVSLERDDEKIKGEFESCVKYGRRRQFESTLLYQESASSEKIARNVVE